MEKENKSTELEVTDKKLIISDVMNIDELIDEYKQAKINIDTSTDDFEWNNLDRRINHLKRLFIEIGVWKYVS